jgi:molecular chaperone DnaJ
VRRQGPSSFGGGAGGFRFDQNDFGGEGLGDLFGQMFGGGRRRNPAGPQRGGDIEATLSLGFAEAVEGITTALHLNAESQCSGCHGTGARPGTAPKQCGQCRGRGVVDDNQGVFAFSSPCQRCNGRGSIIEAPCVGCRGTGIEMRPREVNVRIPAGVDDLTVRLPISFSEATLGADIDVPTLDGTTVKLRLKAGTQSGSRHRVKSKGIDTAKHQGDLIVTVDVAVPTELSDDERQAIEALQHASTTSPRERIIQLATSVKWSS